MGDTVESINALLKEAGTALRHGVSGFVALAVALGLDKDHTILDTLQKQVGGWYSVVGLALVVGVLTYTFHTALYFYAIERFVFRWQINRQLKNLFVKTIDLEDAFRCIAESGDIRWICRDSQDSKTSAIQKRFDDWSAHIHLLYCSGFSVLGVAAIYAFVEHSPCRQTWWAWVLGAALYAVAFLSDLDERRQLIIRHLELQKMWPKLREEVVKARPSTGQ